MMTPKDQNMSVYHLPRHPVNWWTNISLEASQETVHHLNQGHSSHDVILEGRKKGSLRKNRLDKFLNFELTEYLPKQDCHLPKQDCLITKQFEFTLNMKFKYFLLSAEMGVQEQDKL